MPLIRLVPCIVLQFSILALSYRITGRGRLTILSDMQSETLCMEFQILFFVGFLRPHQSLSLTQAKMVLPS